MKAAWFENRELITLYTDPAYFGADVPDSYQQRPSKPVPVKSLFGYEPSSKMDDIHHKDEVLQIALKMKAGTWKGLPIVCRKDPKGYQVLDGHHRMHAARKAGIDTLDAVVVDREDIEYSDEVKEQRINESIDSANNIRQAIELERRAEDQWKRSVGKQFQWKSSAQKLRHIGKVIEAGQDPKKFIRDLNNFYNQYVSFIQKNKLPTELIRLLKQIQKLLVDLNNNLAEASGYIPTAAQANDPRFKTALTVDVRPGEDQRNISKLGLDLNKELVRKTSPGLKKKKKPSLAESLMEQYQVFKEEDLLEVDMSSSALRSWAKSDEAKGVRAGFELELIFVDTQRETDEYGDEADMDYDEPIGTLDDISTFYGYEDAWLNLQPVDEDRFREAVIEDLMDYESKLVVERMMDEEYGLIRDKLEGDENFESMDEDAQDVFLEKEVREQGDIWTEVEEEVKEEVHGSVTWDQFWEHENIQAMSDLLNRYDLVWPHYVEEGGGTSVDTWAQEISEITGKGTNVSAQYHGSPKEQGKYTLEPDSSLSVDDGPDAGWELVSPVMPLDEALDQLEKLFAYIEEKDGDIYTNESTGLHMNISVPQGNDIDYTKLVLFSGDKFILDKYNRLSNNYANSALGQLEARAATMPPELAAEAMQKMKDNLEDTAEEYVRAGTGQAKYTSIHIKDGYIEFRGPGGMYTNKSFGENMDVMLRFARAMTIAADPQAYRQEYQKKLYKTLSKSESSERTIDSLFADFQSGEINKEVFKKRWANLVVQQKQNQAILNRLDDRPDDKRLAKAKQLQKDLGGPVKPWKYTIPYTRPDGTQKTMERQVKASSAQTATQAAVQDALNMFEHPQYKTYTPDFNQLKVQIDLPDTADLKKFAYKIPYTGDSRYQTYDGTITAANRDEARDEIIAQAEYFFQINSQFTPDYTATEIAVL
jgi:hypothetical protein